MILTTVFRQMQFHLDELATIDLGYPQGDNVIRPIEQRACSPSEMDQCGSKWLTPLYSACDGLSFPDVHIGYFIKPLSKVLVFDRASEPDTILLAHEVSVKPIGSTGGGALFVVDCENGRVILLPPGPLRNGQYDGRSAKVKVISESVAEFLSLLLADLYAFVKNNRSHSYISRS